MKKISKKEFLKNEEFYFNEIKKGKIFIYPTDTIYGIGCDATNSTSIEKIRKIKKRNQKPFSIIAPDKNWIFNNCFVKERDIEYIKKPLGAITLILKPKENLKIAKQALVGSLDSIGLRVPNNWFAHFLHKKNVVFVTTSVNISEQEHLTKIEDIKKEISEQVDYAIDTGPLKNRPSTIINLTKNEIEIIKR